MSCYYVGEYGWPQCVLRTYILGPFDEVSSIVKVLTLAKRVRTDIRTEKYWFWMHVPFMPYLGCTKMYHSENFFFNSDITVA